MLWVFGVLALTIGLFASEIVRVSAFMQNVGAAVLFALTVALAASNAFLIPTHRVNALILGPGGYRVGDSVRAGGVMTLLFLIVLLAMLNLLYRTAAETRSRPSIPPGAEALQRRP